METPALPNSEQASAYRRDCATAGPWARLQRLVGGTLGRVRNSRLEAVI